MSDCDRRSDADTLLVVSYFHFQRVPKISPNVSPIVAKTTNHAPGDESDVRSTE
jgi:hypothetical protein